MLLARTFPNEMSFALAKKIVDDTVSINGFIAGMEGKPPHILRPDNGPIQSKQRRVCPTLCFRSRRQPHYSRLTHIQHHQLASRGPLD
ncbi:hypothetical protein BCR44DRAFT_1429013 [Catenaria anguillulae PL171]|uniref:Uncharacterized protein n=1 Tax=Catenaria anguillulae PL171 TaxID=765915 RepID=A0A1Y2HUK1_9FUNG|nr:hypothetical protein BCR44DRAFT_1429013 [Catenaria anguillulae PL171]